MNDISDLQNLELHDAILLGINLDPVNSTAEIRLAYYPSEGASDRIEGTLKFGDVINFNQLLDFELMKKHASFGNISYWVTGETPGLTHIYLARGLISVTSKSVEIVNGV